MEKPDRAVQRVSNKIPLFASLLFPDERHDAPRDTQGSAHTERPTTAGTSYSSFLTITAHLQKNDTSARFRSPSLWSLVRMSAWPKRVDTPIPGLGNRESIPKCVDTPIPGIGNRGSIPQRVDTLIPGSGNRESTPKLWSQFLTMKLARVCLHRLGTCFYPLFLILSQN